MIHYQLNVIFLNFLFKPNKHIRHFGISFNYNYDSKLSFKKFIVFRCLELIEYRIKSLFNNTINYK